MPPGWIMLPHCLKLWSRNCMCESSFYNSVCLHRDGGGVVVCSAAYILYEPGDNILSSKPLSLRVWKDGSPNDLLIPFNDELVLTCINMLGVLYVSQAVIKKRNHRWVVTVGKSAFTRVRDECPHLLQSEMWRGFWFRISFYVYFLLFHIVSFKENETREGLILEK